MRILLVPFDGPPPSEWDVDFADLVLQEEESGDFRASKYRWDVLEAIQVKVWMGDNNAE